jgi:hypothetical protein
MKEVVLLGTSETPVAEESSEISEPFIEVQVPEITPPPPPSPKTSTRVSKRLVEKLANNVVDEIISYNII